MIKVIFILVMSVFMLGCTSAYKPNGFSGGYTDMQMQDDIYKVSFNGNGYTKNERVRDFALLRSAEVTIDKGYSYFIILEGGTDIQSSSYTTPVSSQTYGNVNSFGNTASYSGTTYYSGGQTYNIKKPTHTNIIKCFKEKPSDAHGLVYDAVQIRDNLRSEYKLLEEE